MRCVRRTQLPTKLIRLPVGSANFEHSTQRFTQVSLAEVNNHGLQWLKDTHQRLQMFRKITLRHFHHEEVSQVAVKELPVHDGKDTIAQTLPYVTRPLLSHANRKLKRSDFCPRLEEIGKIIGGPHRMRVCSLCKRCHRGT